jgi:hypothetical protein
VTSAARPARPGRRPVVLAWALWALAILGVGLVAWFDRLVRPAGRSELVLLDANGLISGLAVLSAATVGAVLASRRPEHPVAAAFQPLRRRLRRALDRRFDRRRYHAAQTIQAFSARLRQQVDLDTLTAELLTVVDQTMQPTMVSLWLRPTVAASTRAPTDPPP